MSRDHQPKGAADRGSGVGNQGSGAGSRGSGASRAASTVPGSGGSNSEQQSHTDPLVAGTQREQPTLVEAAPVPVTPTSNQQGAPRSSAPLQPGISGPRRPRSLQQRVQEEAPGRPSRVRSQPLAVRATRKPLSSAVTTGGGNPAQSGWRWTPVVTGLAMLAWVAAAGLLVVGSPALDGRVASPRLTLAVVWGLAAAITFVPIEFRLGLPGLAWQGVTGWVLLAYILAYVPPPTGWLLDLPDLPVYLFLFLALFYAISSAALPLTFLLGQRMYVRRIHRLDVRRARRQAYELGLLVVALMALAALRVLAPLTGLLLVAVFVLVETLFLSQIAPDG